MNLRLLRVSSAAAPSKRSLSSSVTSFEMLHRVNSLALQNRSQGFFFVRTRNEKSFVIYGFAELETKQTRQLMQPSSSVARC